MFLQLQQKIKTNIPAHVPIKAGNFGLEKDSIILVEQVRTLDKVRLKEKIGTLDNVTMEKVKEALKVSLSIRFDINELFEDW